MPLEHNMPRPRSESDEQALSTAWDRLLYTLGSPPADEVSLDKPIRFTQRSEGRAQTPVTVLSGFLGAGKKRPFCVSFLPNHSTTYWPLLTMFLRSTLMQH